jgi:hypothetical protein
LAVIERGCSGLARSSIAIGLLSETLKESFYDQSR